ncbi:MAG: hypothetical protein AAF547_22865 [Actinomycetota bacterium]
MTVRLIVLVVLAAAAVAVAIALQRRRPDPPSAPSYRAPSQLDRDDFGAGARPFLAVVFASTTCNTCPEVWDLVESRASDALGVDRVDIQDRGALHQRYRIDGVPTTVLADVEGVVHRTFFGPMSADAFDEALIELGAAGT